MACYLKRILKDNTKVKKLEVPFEAPVKLNPYMLTWIMSMILKDKKIQSDSALKDELDNILRMYDNWNPQGGKEKDLKNRLEPINLKSKL